MLELVDIPLAAWHICRGQEAAVIISGSHRKTNVGKNPTEIRATNLIASSTL
jgi:hypothetical protein